ncbi:MAG: hypothetical protein RIS70_201 [Planctomycetota bacterium]
MAATMEIDDRTERAAATTIAAATVIVGDLQTALYAKRYHSIFSESKIGPSTHVRL